MASEDIVVRLERVSKSYGLELAALRRVARLIAGGLKRSPKESNGRIWALKDINLELYEGESLGIIGRNGAGKSTLLKILAGVTPPTEGQVEVQRPVFPMIELNAGLSLDLTGRENVYLLGAIMGLPRAEVRARMPQIEEFCELGEYFDQPVRKYSSGMLARLGFSVAINVDADILLVDEVLAVGDFAFQNKCQAHFRSRRGQQTLLYVTHDLVSLPYICDKTIYLANGSIKAAGPSQEVIAQYERDSMLQAHRHALPGGVLKRDTSGHVKVYSFRVTDGEGRSLEEVESGQSFYLSVEAFCDVEVTSPLFAFAIFDPAGNICLWNLSAEDGYTFAPLHGHFRVTAWVPPLPLRGGRYTLNFTMRDGEGYINLERLFTPSLVIKGEGRVHGILAPKLEWCLQRERDTEHNGVVPDQGNSRMMI
jgi:lipopolysaccharide transport system ATP-binding protein